MADPSQSSDGADLGLRAHGRKSIGEPHESRDLGLQGGETISHALIQSCLPAEAAGQPDRYAASIHFLG